MTTGRKLLVGTGAAIIVGMLLIAAFALGVYVGEHGWTREGLALEGPGGDPGRLPQPGTRTPGDRPPLPGGGRSPDVVGRVREILDGSLLLATPDGPRTVELGEHTRVETREGDVRSLDDLGRGQVVAIFGQRNGDGKALVADLVVLLPTQEQPPGGSPVQPRPQR